MTRCVTSNCESSGTSAAGAAPPSAKSFVRAPLRRRRCRCGDDVIASEVPSRIEGDDRDGVQHVARGARRDHGKRRPWAKSRMWRSLQAPLAREPALVPTPLLGTLGKMMPKQKEEARVKELVCGIAVARTTTRSLPCSSLRTLLPFKQNVAARSAALTARGAIARWGPTGGRGRGPRAGGRSAPRAPGSRRRSTCG